MGTIYKVNEEVYTASILENIDLSTPDVIQASIAAPPDPSVTTPQGSAKKEKRESS